MRRISVSCKLGGGGWKAADPDRRHSCRRLSTCAGTKRVQETEKRARRARSIFQRSPFNFQPMQSTSRRCWARLPLDIAYHDTEWGVPLHDDRALFELLTLEGAQAGLSWSTILAKRENYRRAFDHFDAEKISRYGAKKVAALLADAGIVRNRLKVAATIGNAKAFLAVQKEFGSFDHYLWSFVPDRRPIVNRRRALSELPTRTPQSDALSTDLLARGFKFVGSTIIYAFMQATGMVNDHLVTCDCHARCAKLR